jgi:hypothetical protein
MAAAPRHPLFLRVTLCKPTLHASAASFVGSVSRRLEAHVADHSHPVAGPTNDLRSTFLLRQLARFKTVMRRIARGHSDALGRATRGSGGGWHAHHS